MDDGDLTTARPIREGLFSLDPEPHLIGSMCKQCNRYFYPTRHICPACGWDQLETCLLSKEGTIMAFTVIHSKPPLGFVIPYVVGYVELAENNLVIPSIISAASLSDIQDGASVNLIVEPISKTPEGSRKLIYKFQVEEGA